MERRWTDAQKQAINARDCTLLVSAAAGSGKTAVLTERLIERLRDPEHPADLDRMLIVTFTRTAAGELKERIACKLAEALESDPTNRYLAKQLSSVSGAKISTIDSFCADLVKHNFDKLGLPCGMHIVDEGELSLMKSKIMNALFDDLYGGQIDFDDFERFTDVFISDRDDSLPELFLSLYHRLSSFSGGIELLREHAEMLLRERDMPFLTTRHGAFVREYLAAFVDTYEQRTRQGVFHFEGETKSAVRYYTEFCNMYACVCKVRDALAQDDFEAVCAAVSEYSSVDMSGVRLAPEDRLIYKSVRDQFRADVAAVGKTILGHTPEQIRRSYTDTAELLSGLYRFLTVFEEKFAAEKRTRRALDYTDVERFTLALLKDGDGPSDFARAYGEGLDEIYIDEYQDINGLQDEIFRLLAGRAHRFMVGDIKQSIYKFRGGDPAIFAGYRSRFAAYDPQTPRREASVFLSANFRCARPVVDFCNTIFSTLMRNTFDSIDYREEDDLLYGKQEDEPVTAPVEVALLQSTCRVTEAEYVASRVSELLREGYAPDDIVLLMRSPKNSAKPFEQALEQVGILCFRAESSEFFENPEILLAMCLLNIIDNPRRDIYLAGALRSPVFGFTLDELVRIRASRKGGYLWDAFCEYAGQHPGPKTDAVFSFLDEMRDAAKKMPIDRLIWQLYTTTGLLCDVYGESEADEQRRSNLMLLYEYARKFESGSFKGLYQFILYVEQSAGRGDQKREAKSGAQGEGGVRIMSIHASKGLEFKVCILCATNSTFRAPDDNELLFDSRLGIGLFTAEQTGFGRVNSILRKTVALKAQTDRIAEEMRILYVALTRAKERLIVTGKAAKDFMGKCESRKQVLTTVTVLSCNSLISMIMTALQGHEGDPYWTLRVLDAEYEAAAPVPRDLPQGQTAHDTPDLDTCKQVLADRFAFRYPYTDLSAVPSKLSVSRLYPAVLDEIDQPPEVTETQMARLPRFLEGEAQATPAERGTATHVFMQFCDFELVLRHGVHAEIGRLIEKKFIPEHYRALIRTDALEQFFRSPLFERMRSARRLWRETRFNITLPAASFTEQQELRGALGDERILVQGVIDCFFEDADGAVTVVDYKTDTFTRAQHADPEECARILRQRHGAQLGYYRLALAELLGRTPEHTLIYSFDLDREIEL